MELQDIYLGVMDLLSQVPELKWIDQDYGQLDDPDVRPAVAFPCALIGTDLVRCQDIGMKKQKCPVQVNIKIGFNYAGESSAVTPLAVRDKALEYYRVLKSVYLKLQGARIGELTPLKRASQVEASRPDRIKIVEMPFNTEFIDVTAAV